MINAFGSFFSFRPKPFRTIFCLIYSFRRTKVKLNCTTFLPLSLFPLFNFFFLLFSIISRKAFRSEKLAHFPNEIMMLVVVVLFRHACNFLSHTETVPKCIPQWWCCFHRWLSAIGGSSSASASAASAISRAHQTRQYLSVCARRAAGRGGTHALCKFQRKQTNTHTHADR